MAGKKSQKIGTKGSKKGVYNKYSFEERTKLISMVQDQHRTLASSAKELGICQTTARLIMSTWKEQGRVFQKKSDRTKRQRREHKKRAQEKRKPRSQRQLDEQPAQIEAQNLMSSLKIEEDKILSQDGSVGVDDAHHQITENAVVNAPQLLQYQIPYQFVQIGGMLYMQPMFYAPPFYSML